jgi:hypothetical protein
MISASGSPVKEQFSPTSYVFNEDDYYNKLQAMNPLPTPKQVEAKNQNSDNVSQSQSKNNTNKIIPLPPLTTGDLFGEIGVLTNLRRTCTIETKDNCIF